MSNCLPYYPEAHYSPIRAALGRAFSFLARVVSLLLRVILYFLAGVVSIVVSYLLLGPAKTFAILAAICAVFLFALAFALGDKQ